MLKIFLSVRSGIKYFTPRIKTIAKKVLNNVSGQRESWLKILIKIKILNVLNNIEIFSLIVVKGPLALFLIIKYFISKKPGKNIKPNKKGRTAD